MRNIAQILLFSVAFTSFCATLTAQTQTGPGGVGTSANIAVWLDANNMNLNDGDPVATWPDISGNNADFNQAVLSSQPSFNQVGSVNSLPSVFFDGDDFLDLNAYSTLSTDVVTWYTVVKNSGAFGATGSKRGIIETSSTTFLPIWGSFYNKETASTFAIYMQSFDNVPATKFAISPLFNTASLNSAKIVSGFWRANNNINIFVDGAGGSTGVNANIAPGTHITTRLGRRIFNPTQFFEGEMNEIIIFNAELNLAQNIIINNYLNTKYGITINGVMERYTFEATHSQDLAGIGRLDINNQHLSARGTSIVEVTSTSLDDLDFLFWAHDDGVFTTNEVNIPASYSTTFGERMERTWRVSETGETGTITLSFDLTGIHFGHPNDYELLIDSDGDFTSGTTIISGSLVGDIVSFTVTGAQLSSGNFFTVANSNASVIRSIVSGQDWNQTSTWSCTCIPLITDYVVISDNHIVSLTDNQNAARLTVRSNGELSISNSGLLNITEHLNVIGTIVSDPAGTINFMGSALQTVNTNGTINFGSLTMNNSSVGAQLQTGNYTLSGVLTLTDGDLDLGGNQFTFTSSASGTASIGVLTGAATLLGSGNARVQRFIPSGVAGYRNIGTPQTNMPLEEWDNELFISGPGFPDGCSFSSNGCYRSARLWNATTQQYVGIDNISTLIPNGTGVEIWLGDNLTSFSQNTLTSAGEINMDLSSNITIRNGWNLVSNPFLAPIDFDNITRNSAGTGNYHYVWDPNTNGFQFWDGGAQSASVAQLNNGILSAFQGFWVFHSGANTTITINQSAKSIGSSDAFLRQTEGFRSLDYFTIELSNPRVGHRINSGVKFDSEFSSELDSYDIPSLPSEMVDKQALSLYTKTTNGENVVVNSQPSNQDCFVIPLFYNTKIEGDYKLTFNNIPSEYACILMDKQLGVSKVIANGSEYVFNQIESTLGNNRFDLNFEKYKECEINEGTNVLILNNANFNGFNVEFKLAPKEYTVEVFNLMGQKIYDSKIINDPSVSKEFKINDIVGVNLVVIKDSEGNLLSTEKILFLK